MVIEEEVAKEDMDPLIPFPDNQDENSWEIWAVGFGFINPNYIADLKFCPTKIIYWLFSSKYPRYINTT